MSKIKTMKTASAINDKIMEACLKNFSNFKTEKNVMDFLRKEYRRHKVKFSFYPIIASGKNAYALHYKPTNKRLQKGFCVIDIGVKYNGYCSDMTRMAYLGKPTKKEKEMYAQVLKVQKAVINKIKKGINPLDLHKYAKKKLGRRFIHAIGHGIGKKVHDKPILSKKSKETLKVNDVICIEPGLYYKNKYGIRIEDVVSVKKDKGELLTNTSRRLVVVDR